MSWFDFVPSLLNVGANIYGAVTKNNANDQASQVSTDAERRATQQELDGINAAKGNYASSITNDQALQTQSAPGVAQQQLAISQQNTLTPAQQLALTNARRDTINNLNTSGLAGSGRAAVAATNQVSNTMQTGFMDTNRARADTAASGLSNQYFTSGRDINTQNSNIGNANIQGGKVAGAGTLGIGQIQSGNIIGNAGVDASTAQNVAGALAPPVAGQAINDINSAVNAYNKSRSTYTGPNVVGGADPNSPQKTQTLGGTQ